MYLFIYFSILLDLFLLDSFTYSVQIFPLILKEFQQIS